MNINGRRQTKACHRSFRHPCSAFVGCFQILTSSLWRVVPQVLGLKTASVLVKIFLIISNQVVDTKTECGSQTSVVAFKLTEINCFPVDTDPESELTKILMRECQIFPEKVIRKSGCTCLVCFMNHSLRCSLTHRRTLGFGAPEY